MNIIAKPVFLGFLIVFALVACDHKVEPNGQLSSIGENAIPPPGDLLREHPYSLDIEPFLLREFLDPEIAGQVILNEELFLDVLQEAVYERYPMGYAIALVKDGELQGVRSGGKAQAPWDGNIEFSPSTKFHIASTTKALTSLAILGALNDRGLTLNDKISPFLPAHWDQGPGVDEVTFFQLLTHRSGLAISSDQGGARFSLARLSVESGNENVAAGRCGTSDSSRDPFSDAPTSAAADIPEEPFCPGDPRYQNPMFIVAKIVLALLDQEFDPSVCQGRDDLDSCWNAGTTEALVKILKDRVFTPAGLTEISFDRGTKFALAYSDNTDTRAGRGNRGKIINSTGAVGIYLSLEELSKLVGAFASPEGIVSPSDRIDMLRFGFGYTRDYLDPQNSLTIQLAGVDYVLPGWGGTWAGASEADRDQRETNQVIFFPGNYQFIVMINSLLPASIPYSETGSRPELRWIRCSFNNAMENRSVFYRDCP